MDLSKLVIRNFQSVQDATLYLKDKGLVSIEGVNKDATGADSNGSGKSTVINAILWNGYGDDGKELAADEVVNDEVGKNCMVQGHYEEDDHLYIITRYRKHTEFKNAITIQHRMGSGPLLDITKAGAREVQAQINEILGQDRKTFEANCFARQEGAPDIPAMSDRELKELLESTLPFEDEELDLCFKKASANLTAQQKVISDIDKKLELNRVLLQHLRVEGGEAVKSLKKWREDEAGRKESFVFRLAETDRELSAAKSTLASDEPILARIDTLNKALADYDNTELTKLRTMLVNLTMAEKDFRRQISSIDDLLHCNSCGQPLEGKDRKEIEKGLTAQLEDTTRQAEKVRREINVAEITERKYSIIQGQIKEAEASLRDNTKRRDLINVLEAAKKRVEDERQSEPTNPHAETVERLRVRFQDAKAKVTSYEEELEEAKSKLPVLEATQYLYSPKGIRYHMLEEVTPFLNDRTNFYLKQLTDGAIGAIWSTVSKTASGEYREKFSITIQMRKRNNFKSLSGGEKRKVRLACFFALQDLISRRATKSINLWCGDEIDEALDGAGLERLMSLLEAKTKTKSTILVISHNQLREWIPNYAIATRKGDVTTVTGYLNGD